MKNEDLQCGFNEDPQGESNEQQQCVSNEDSQRVSDKGLQCQSYEDLICDSNEGAEILLIEPFYGGSHRQLIDLLYKEVPHCLKVTMTAKKWHWRSRVAALHLSQVTPESSKYRTLFCSSILNLAELIALRPDLGKLKKILYFHENQLIYPVQVVKDRDAQFGYNQIISSLTADVVVFNSKYNMESFLSCIDSFLKLLPDYRPKGLAAKIRPKCKVIYFPLNIPDTNISNQECYLNREIKTKNKISDDRLEISNINLMAYGASEGKAQNVQYINVCSDSNNHDDLSDGEDRLSEKSNLQPNISHDTEDTTKDSRPLHIVWPHRWEHDKNPDTFFNTMIELHKEGCSFLVSVIGEHYTDNPEIFEKSREILSEHILHWGYQERRSDYYDILKCADVVVSTALHEFFGVSMLEAVYYGCYPLCPNRLVYPEIYPKKCLYNTDNQLYKMLRRFCQKPSLVREHQLQVTAEPFLWKNTKHKYFELLNK